MAVTEDDIDPKYGKLDKELVALLREYEVKYFREDKPVPFLPGLDIYPIPVRYFEEFANCSGCLSLNKNEDAKGIRMSHLEYLLNKVTLPPPEGNIWAYKIYRLFELIFHLEPGYECDSCHTVMKYDSPEITKFNEEIQGFVKKIQEINEKQQKGELTQEDIQKLGETLQEPHLKCPSCGNEKFNHIMKIVEDPQTHKLEFMIKGQKLDKKDFNKLRQIVLFQNYPDYVDDSWVDPDLRADRAEKLRLEQQMQDLHASIEQKVVCLSISTCYKFNEIYDMSIRKFTMALSKVDDLINYKLLKQAQYSGFSGLPKDFKVDHWIYKPNKDMYGDSYKSTDSIQAV